MSKFRVGVTASFYDPNGKFNDGGMDLSPLVNEPGVEVVRVRATPVLEPADTADLDALFIREVELYNASSVHPNGRLAHLSRLGVGYDNIDVPTCDAAAVALTTTPDASRRPMATATLTLLFNIAFHVKEKEAYARKGGQEFLLGPKVTGAGFVGKTLGVVGLGNIGREVVRLARAFDFKFIAHDPYVSDAIFGELGVERVGLLELFRRSDFIAVNCALTDETRHMIDAKCFAAMKPSAYLVNAARGPVIKQADLVKALRDRRMAGAGLDVMDPEPMAANDPLNTVDHPNVVLTPHAIGFTDQIMTGMCEMVNSCILAVKHGQVPRGLVNPEIQKNQVWLEKLKRYGAARY